MNTKLDIVRFECDDVIATSGCAGLDQYHLYLSNRFCNNTSQHEFIYYYTSNNWECVVGLPELEGYEGWVHFEDGNIIVKCSHSEVPAYMPANGSECIDYD